MKINKKAVVGPFFKKKLTTYISQLDNLLNVDLSGSTVAWASPTIERLWVRIFLNVI